MGVFRQDLCAKFDERVDHIFDLPYFAFRTAAIRRRIHDDRVISIAAADLPFDKFLHNHRQASGSERLSARKTLRFLSPSRPCLFEASTWVTCAPAAAAARVAPPV